MKRFRRINAAARHRLVFDLRIPALPSRATLKPALARLDIAAGTFGSRLTQPLFTELANLRQNRIRATGTPKNAPCRHNKSRLQKNVKAIHAIILAIAVNTLPFFLTQAQSSNVIGSWNIEITFADEQHRFLRFDAQSDGKGSLTVTDAKSKVWLGTKPSEAKWTLNAGDSVTFSGPAEFLIGNVGRDAGTLTFKGKFDTTGSITGQVEFSPLVGDRPSRSGTFKAVRTSG